MPDFRKAHEDMVKRLTDSAEREFGIPRDVARKGAIKRADRAMERVVREHEQKGTSRTIEID